MKTSQWTDSNAVRYAWIGWALLFFTVAAIMAAGSQRTVVVAYRDGALDWIAGRGMYTGEGIGGFVYLPQAAMLFVPLALLPKVVGEILWRLAAIGTLALGLRSFARLTGEKSGIELFSLMTLVSIPLAWDCARNGQATLPLTGLMLLTVVDVARGRWWRATLWLSLGVAVKPVMIVPVLLIMAIDRPMIWRVPIGMVLVALSPFLMQRPDYVLQQYSAFLHNTTTASHVAVVAQGWSSPFNALQFAGVHVPERVQTAVRIVAAFATLALCRLARRRHDAVRSAIFVFSLSVIYLLLFSPRTETNTYAMLGPAVAAFLAPAYLIEGRTTAGNLLFAIALATGGNRFFQYVLTPHADTDWLPPLMGVCFAVYVVVRLFKDPAVSGGGTTPGPATGDA